jgi:GNAT superfamily N-acetyltransferase
MDFEIEEVLDIEGLWPELEPLMLGIIEYHKPWDSRELRPDWAARMRKHLVVSSETVTLLARADGRAVGFLNGNVRLDYGIYDDAIAYIANAFVEDEARGSGIGSALVARFEEWSQHRGASDLMLNVAAGNQLGIEFWNKSGFTIWGHSMVKTLEGAV